MKILIVDDNNRKVMDISDAIQKIEGISNHNLIKETSIMGALNRLSKDHFDFVILDMCIPEEFGSALLEDGGLKLIEIIVHDKRYIKPNDVILLTAYSDYVNKFEEKLYHLPFGIELYDDTSNEWKHKIVSKIKYQLIRKSSVKEKRKYDYDVAIITAVEVEKNAVLSLSDDWKSIEIPTDSTYYMETTWIGKNRDIKVITATLPQMGLVSATAIASKVIMNFTPKYIIMPGIAGGLKEDYEFGDIIVPKEVKDYCSGKYITPTEGNVDDNPLVNFIPSSLSISTDMDIVNSFSKSYDQILHEIHSSWHYKNDYKIPKIRTGHMASGDSVIQNKSVIDILIKKHLRFADALDMEAYGIYYAAQQAMNPKPIPICMKSISDFANKEKNDDHQSYASFISSNFLKYYVTNELFFE